jgi:methyl-accepting chemotaxis protein
MSDVKVKFGAEDENLNATLTKVKDNLKDVQGETEETAKGFDVGFKTIAGAAAVGAVAAKAAFFAIEMAADAARAVVDRFGDAIAFGGKMDDLSKQTGVAAGELTILGRAFDNCGIGAEKLGPKIGRMQKFIDEASNGGKTQQEIMSRLGLAYQDVEGKTPTEQLRMLGERLAQIQDPGERAALSMKVFGGRTADMIPLIMNMGGELDEAQRQVGGFAEIMDESSGDFDAFGDNMDAVKSKTMEFAAGFLSKALPALVSFSEKLAGIDSAGFGAKLMESVIKFADILIGAFKNPMQAAGLLGDALMYAAKEFGNAIINNSIDFANRIGPVMIAGLLGVATDFKYNMQLAGVAIIEGLVKGFMEFAKMVGGPIEENAKKMIQPLVDGLKMSAREYDSDMRNAHREIEDNLANIMANTKDSTVDFFGAQGELDKILEGTAKLEKDGKKFREEFEKSAEESDKMKEDFKEVDSSAEDAANAAREAAFQLSNAGKPMKENTREAKNDMVQIKTIGDLLKQQDQAPPMKSFKEQVNEARVTLERIKDIIGKDLSDMSLPDIAKQMGIDPARKSAEQLFKEIQERIKAITGSQIDLLINKDLTKEELQKVLEQIKLMGYDAGKPIDLNLDAKKSIETIKASMKEEIDVALGSSKGTTILETMNAAVIAIRDCVKLIEPKLPQRALT